MKLPHRRLFCIWPPGGCRPAGGVAVASAQAYPSGRCVSLCHLLPEGTFDLFARLIGQWLSERLRQPFIVENRPGAGTNIGTEAVVRAAPDGYTLLMASTAATISPRSTRSLASICSRHYAGRGRRSYAVRHVGDIHRFPPSASRIHCLRERRIPANSAWRRLGSGRSPCGGRVIQDDDGLTMVHVPYRGAGPALTDLIAGQVHLYFTALPEAIEHIRVGRIRVLAVTTSTRSKVLRDIPTCERSPAGIRGKLLGGFASPMARP